MSAVKKGLPPVRHSLCEYCDRPNRDKCSAYRKDPTARVVNCGRYEPDFAKQVGIGEIRSLLEKEGKR